ncbi:MAG: SH3 domain-containing protein [Anaerolineae bacterium]|nr:SH3 domain-containing protein [Anaerolineae bacterium]
MKTPRFTTVKTICLALLLLLVPVGQALAGDIYVDEDCSLQNAVRAANEEAMVAPLNSCEAGIAADGIAQVDENGADLPPGSDKITIRIAGTDEGIITLDGALDVTTHIVIDGSGYVIEGDGNQIFDVTAGSLTVSNLTMNGGWSDDNGGAITVDGASVKLVNSVVRGSGARELGGAIYAVDSDLTIIESAVSGNATGVLTKPEAPAETSADDSSAGTSQVVDVEVIEASVQAESVDEVAEASSEEPITWDTSGGGIYFNGADNRLTIDRSGLDTNVSLNHGGGLYIAAGSATITNSTFSGNAAGGEGGALYNAGDSELTHVTVVFNSAADVGGIVNLASLELYNSIVADNAGGDCSGTLNALIGNLIRDLSCSHDGLSDDPMLLLLGGAPAYYVPQDGSPAIDAASADHCLANDQRGISRDAATCDIGAAEYEQGVFGFQIQSALAVLTPGSGGSGASPEGDADIDDEAEEAIEVLPAPIPSNCPDLPGHIRIAGHTNGSNVNCRHLGYSGLGSQILVDGGALHAVNIFGWVAKPISACFQHHSGAIVLLDTAKSPREIVPLRTSTEFGWQCAQVDRIGTVVLMPPEFFTSGLIPEPIWSLSECTVTTVDILNLRAQPRADSEVLANVLNDVTMTAEAHANRFYRVNYYGIVGWLSMDYLSFAGACV